MVSVDCAEYASHLVAKDWSKTREFLWKWGISRLIGMLERGEVDFIVQCSNTSHMALEEDKLAELQANYHSMLLKHQSKFLHIADATANAIRKQNDKKPLIVGLLGTEPTMREDYLKDRLLLHSDCVQRVVSPSKDGPRMGYSRSLLSRSFGHSHHSQYCSSSRQPFVPIAKHSTPAYPSRSHASPDCAATASAACAGCFSAANCAASSSAPCFLCS